MNYSLVTQGARLFMTGLALVFLANCSHVHLFQDPEHMLVGVGSERKTYLAAPYADRFLIYALIADQTYADITYKTKRVALGPRTYCFRAMATDPVCQDFTPYAHQLLNEWRLIYAKKKTSDFPCKPERAHCTEPLPGLGVQIWVRKGRFCQEAVIAFRGTDGASADDWLSNLRWITRFLPLHDQYDQVQDYTADFVREITRNPCFVQGHTRVVGIGHSLGGGLAQQAAYRHGAIRRVFTFDPSVVTGYYDLDVAERERNSRDLKIERIYEHGEILAYPRFVMRQLYPASACNPQIRTIRFNTLHGGSISQHNLSNLATSLLHWSWTQPPRAKEPRLPNPNLEGCPSTPRPPKTQVQGTT